MSLEHAPHQQGATVVAYLTSAQVRARYGGISDMTVWRWLTDPAMAFPQPIYINRRRYWRLDLLDRFDATRAEAA